LLFSNFTDNSSGLLIFGFGGHARSVADIAFSSGVSNFCFVDSNAREGESFIGHPVIKQWEGSLPKGWQAISANGNNVLRQESCEYIKNMGWTLATLIAPSATTGIGSKIAEGSVIAHQAHIGPMASIGKGCIINTAAVVEHESKIGDFVHISVNSTIAGRSTIGDYSFIGAGATVIDGINVCNNVIVGAGSVVIRNIDCPGVYVGSPACLVQKR
jgi:sugar O-acyltransferase (sialic acid O-acetyltransferase NeuD family)